MKRCLWWGSGHVMQIMFFPHTKTADTHNSKVSVPENELWMLYISYKVLYNQSHTLWWSLSNAQTFLSVTQVFNYFLGPLYMQRHTCWHKSTLSSQFSFSPTQRHTHSPGKGKCGPCLYYLLSVWVYTHTQGKCLWAWKDKHNNEMKWLSPKSPVPQSHRF